MSWTDERVALLRQCWDEGKSASQIAELLGDGLSRNAVIGKAHRLGLAARPSPLKARKAKAAEAKAGGEAEAAPKPRATRAPKAPKAQATPEAAPAPVKTASEAAPAPTPPAPSVAPPKAEAKAPPAAARPVAEPAAARPEPPVEAPVAKAAPRPVEASVTREVHMPAQPPRPARRPGDKVTLLDLNDRICKWPIGHPDEPDFHFCGKPVNPGFPYCGEHCLVAYQAQMPRRDRPAGPPRPFGPNLPRPR